MAQTSLLGFAGRRRRCIRFGVGQGDRNHADVGVEPERVPDGLGRANDVVLASCNLGGSRTRP